jgi:hypothetical protein
MSLPGAFPLAFFFFPMATSISKQSALSISMFYVSFCGDERHTSERKEARAERQQQQQQRSRASAREHQREDVRPVGCLMA